MAAIVRDPVTPPSAFRTDCPPELEHLILKAISRDPADRFQSADEMSRQLAHVQRAVRYAADPGLTRLQEPMPPRNPTTRRARVPAAHAAAAPASELATAVTAASARIWPLSRLAIAGGAALAVGLVLTRALPFGRDRDQVSATPLVTAAPFAADHNATVPAPGPQPPATTLVAAPAAPLPSPALDEIDTAATPAGSEKPHQATAPETRSRPREQRSTRRDGATSVAGDKDDSANIRALLDEAASAFVLGQMPRARSIYQQVLARQPAQADAWRGLGLAASRMGQRKDAEHAFERYLKLRPNAPDAERIREQLDKVR